MSAFVVDYHLQPTVQSLHHQVYICFRRLPSPAHCSITTSPSISLKSSIPSHPLPSDDTFLQHRTHSWSLCPLPLGTRMTPSYANLFKRSHEKECLKQENYKPDQWLMFIYNIFKLWTNGLSLIASTVVTLFKSPISTCQSYFLLLSPPQPSIPPLLQLLHPIHQFF